MLRFSVFEVFHVHVSNPTVHLQADRRTYNYGTVRYGTVYTITVWYGTLR